MARTPRQQALLRSAKENATEAKTALIRIWSDLEREGLPAARLGRAIDAIERWQNT